MYDPTPIYLIIQICIINHLYQIKFSFNHNSFSHFPFSHNDILDIWKSLGENYIFFFLFVIFTYLYEMCFSVRLFSFSFLFSSFSFILPFIMFHAFVLLIHSENFLHTEQTLKTVREIYNIYTFILFFKNKYPPSCFVRYTFFL